MHKAEGYCMLDSLKVKRFTAFSEAEFIFAKGLNVLVGENGTGKTHVLKVAYSTIYVSAKFGNQTGTASPTKADLQRELTNKLISVFKTGKLERLARRTARGRQRTEVSCQFSPATHNLAFAFSTLGHSPEIFVERMPSDWINKVPVYLPTRELVTIYPGFVPLYETTHLQFDETWRDTCILLGAPLAKGTREKKIKELLGPLETAMGGKLELTFSGEFGLLVDGIRMEMHLVAEGLRKLAMIARLIATGSLIDQGFLFWDEPESNLNPKIIKLIARTILHLCQNGIQVFIASHSLFLLREFDILLKTDEFKKLPARFFGLHKGDNGVGVRQGESVDDIGDISALDEELQQSDRYLRSEVP